MISHQPTQHCYGTFVAYFGQILSITAVGQSDSLGVSCFGAFEDNVWRWMLGLEIVPASYFLALLFHSWKKVLRWLAF